MKKKPWTARSISKLRASLGETQAEFAKRLGVTITTVSRWEHAFCQPSKLAQERLDKAQRIAT